MDPLATLHSLDAPKLACQANDFLFHTSCLMCYAGRRNYSASCNLGILGLKFGWPLDQISRCWVGFLSKCNFTCVCFKIGDPLNWLVPFGSLHLLPVLGQPNPHLLWDWVAYALIRVSDGPWVPHCLELGWVNAFEGLAPCVSLGLVVVPL